MSSEFDTQSELVDLCRRSRQGAVAFAAACCERLLPYYAPFAAKAGWGDPDTLRSVLDSAWRVAGSSEERAFDPDHLRACQRAIPDADEFEGFNVDSAQQAALSVCNLAMFLLEADPVALIRCSQSVIDAVDTEVQFVAKISPRNRDRDAMIATHPLMLRELDRQRRDLAALQAEPVSQVLAVMLARSKAEAALEPVSRSRAVTKPDLAEIEAGLLGLLDALSDVLSPPEVGNVAEFIQVGEYGLALETLSEILVEEQKCIPLSALREMDRLAGIMGIRNTVMADAIKKQVTED